MGLGLGPPRDRVLGLKRKISRHLSPLHFDPILRLAPQLVLDEGCAVSSGDLGCACRACPYPTASAPLAVSGPRGVACVFSGLQRVLLYDLEETEESDEEEDERGQLSGGRARPAAAPKMTKPA